MVKLKKFNISGKETGDIEVDKAFTESTISNQLIKDYIVAIRKNARQWSANTKGRSEVKHTTKKAYPQKGRGGARHGSLVAPQFRGGGVVFGPKPKFDQHTRINKKERQAAIRHLLAEKINAGHFIILDEPKFDAPKTKTVSEFLKKCELNKRVLFLGEGNTTEIQVGDTKKSVSVACKQHDHFRKSIRNIPKISFSLASNISGYDVMVAHHIVATEKAFAEITEWLKPGSKGAANKS